MHSAQTSKNKIVIIQSTASVTNVSHEMLEVFWADGAGAVLVQDSEGHPDHIGVVDGVHLVGHHVAELRKLNHAGAVSIVLNNNKKDR